MFRSVPFRFGKFRYVSFRFVPFRFVSVNFRRFISFRSVSFRFGKFRYVSFRFVPFRYISFRVSFRILQVPKCTEGLICFYTKADSLSTKIDELGARPQKAGNRYDITGMTEVYQKTKKLQMCNR